MMETVLCYPALSTHQGRRRDNNEDAVGFRYPKTLTELHEYGAMFLLADGVGGLEGGEVASDMAVRLLLETYYQTQAESIETRLVDAIQATNRRIYDAPGKSATTLVAVVVHGRSMTVASIGDSVAYWLDSKGIQKVTEDHVMVIDPQNPKKRKLTRALGHKDMVKIDTITGPITPNGQVIIVSDGATRYLKEADFERICSHAQPHDAVREIIKASNDSGGADNISAVVVRFDEPIDNQDFLKQHVETLNAYIQVPEWEPPKPSVQQSPPKPIAQPQIDAVIDTTPDRPYDDLVSPTESTYQPPNNWTEPAPSPLSTVPGYEGGQMPPPSDPLNRTQKQPAPPQATESTAQRSRLPLLIVFVLVAVLATGGLLFALSNNDTPDTESGPPQEEQQVTSADDDLPEEVQTVAPTPTRDMSLGLIEGDEVQFEDTALTYENIDDNVSAFILVIGNTYRVIDIFTTRDDVKWYRLRDIESERDGWINENALPEYELLP